MARITMRKTQETKLSEIFTLYLASAAARGVKDKTLRTYEQHFKAISKRLDVDSNISQITSKDLDSDAFPHPILPKPFYGAPNTVCNESYLVIGPFANEEECRNAMSYIATKFFRFLVLQKKNSQNAAKGVYQFVPQQDFSKPWTDEELYKKYGISEEEIAFIDSMIKPMDLEGDSDGE